MSAPGSGGRFLVVLVGILILPFSILLVAAAEGGALSAFSALDQGLGQLVEVGASAVDPASEGKLVHVVGAVATPSPAHDPVFDVGAPALLRVKRRVEMYQWQEWGSRSSPTYTMTWSDVAIDSRQFHGGYDNPPFPVRSETFYGDPAMLGAYRIDPRLLDRLQDSTSLFPKSPKPPAGYRALADSFYHGRDPDHPAIGDVRVSFTGLTLKGLSVVGQQQAGALVPYPWTKTYNIALATPGTATAEAMVGAEKSQQATATWALRAFGFILMVMTCLCFTRPLSLARALLYAVPLTLVTAGTVWLFFRPVTGLVVVAAAATAFIVLRRLRRRSVPVAPPAAAAPPPGQTPFWKS